jgi:threonine/homoserine/homoserine lactone efflux protein
MSGIKIMRFINGYSARTLGFCYRSHSAMDIASLFPLAVFTIVSTITPGGATTMVAASGAHFGLCRSLPLVAGIATGLASMAAAAAAGLASTLMAMPSLQLLMKASGTLYLLWLAWKVGRAGKPRDMAAAATPATFIGGAWMLWHNPKGWAMTMGAAASFGALAAGPVQLAALLAVVFGVAATLSLMLWCLAGQMLARMLRSDRQWRMLNMVLALLLAGSIAPMWLS